MRENIKLKFYNGIKLNYKNIHNSIFIVSSKYANDFKIWSERSFFDTLILEFKDIRKQNRLFWADMGDSSGVIHTRILPYVDKYLKGSILKDKEQYLKTFYGYRMFSDYYKNNNGIIDSCSNEEHLTEVPNKKDLEKIKLYWNQAYVNYYFFPVLLNKILMKYHILPFLNLKKFVPVNKKRNIDVHCRFGLNYYRNTIAYQRKRVKEILGQKYDISRVSMWQYFLELTNSKIVISPFGWGEICYRDFETFEHGGALLKPDCSHLITFPNIYQDDFYISVKWDLSDLQDKINVFLKNDSRRISVAENGQKFYKSIFNKDGLMSFKSHFLNLIR